MLRLLEKSTLVATMSILLTACGTSVDSLHMGSIQVSMQASGLLGQIEEVRNVAAFNAGLHASLAGTATTFYRSIAPNISTHRVQIGTDQVDDLHAEVQQASFAEQMMNQFDGMYLSIDNYLSFMDQDPSKLTSNDVETYLQFTSGFIAAGGFKSAKRALDINPTSETQAVVIKVALYVAQLAKLASVDRHVASLELAETSSGYGWQPDLGGPNGGSCRQSGSLSESSEGKMCGSKWCDPSGKSYPICKVVTTTQQPQTNQKGQEDGKSGSSQGSNSGSGSSTGSSSGGGNGGSGGNGGGGNVGGKNSAGYSYCTNGSNTGNGYGWDTSVTDVNGSHSCAVQSASANSSSASSNDSGAGGLAALMSGTSAGEKSATATYFDPATMKAECNPDDSSIPYDMSVAVTENSPFAPFICPDKYDSQGHDVPDCSSVKNFKDYCGKTIMAQAPGQQAVKVWVRGLCPQNHWNNVGPNNHCKRGMSEGDFDPAVFFNAFHFNSGGERWFDDRGTYLALRSSRLSI